MRGSGAGGAAVEGVRGRVLLVSGGLELAVSVVGNVPLMG
jgi:hypothetical protein